jgi:hypothetical protein
VSAIWPGRVSATSRHRVRPASDRTWLPSPLPRAHRSEGTRRY